MLAPLVLPGAVFGSIFTYSSVTLRPDVIQYRRVGMFAPADAPALGAPGDGTSSVSLDLTFRRAPGTAQRPGLLQVLLFPSDALPRIGVTHVGAAGPVRTLCCTSALRVRNVPGCTAVGRLIVAPSAASGGSSAAAPVVSHDVLFAANRSDATLSQRVAVEKSGRYYLLLSSCEVRTGAVTYSGSTSWRNPYGYLPGELYPFLPCYGAFACAYTLLAVGWAVLSLRHLPQLLPLQGAIGVSAPRSPNQQSGAGQLAGGPHTTLPAVARSALALSPSVRPRQMATRASARWLCCPPRRP